MRVDDVLEPTSTRHVDGNDHFEFFWVPHTGWALTKRNNRTDEPAGADAEVHARGADKVLMENSPSARSATSAGRGRSWIPRLAQALPSSGRERVHRHAATRCSPARGIVQFYEMEYAIPREACAEALNRVRALVDRRADCCSASRSRCASPPPTTSRCRPRAGGESAYIAVHVFQRHGLRAATSGASRRS